MTSWVLMVLIPLAAGSTDQGSYKAYRYKDQETCRAEALKLWNQPTLAGPKPVLFCVSGENLP